MLFVPGKHLDPKYGQFLSAGNAKGQTGQTVMLVMLGISGLLGLFLTQK